MNNLHSSHIKIQKGLMVGWAAIFLFLALPMCLYSQITELNDDDPFIKDLKSVLKMPYPENAAAYNKLTNTLDLDLSDKQLSMTFGNRRIKAPIELAGGWVPGSDSSRAIRNLAGDNNKLHKNIQKSLIIWGWYIFTAPQEAFTAMLSRADVSTPTIVDAVRILAVTDRLPGKQLNQQISKVVWKQLYESNNPALKIIALEKYDSTEQSPDELLSLYRECLMDSFGYLQVRALEGIYRSKDYRPEVAALLKEYLNSNPEPDDGTLPAFPSTTANPVDGAKMILAEMESVGSSVVATQPIFLPAIARARDFTATLQPSTPTPQAPEAKPSAQTASEESTSSTPWSIILVLIVAAGVLLWLLLRRRS